MVSTLNCGCLVALVLFLSHTNVTAKTLEWKFTKGDKRRVRCVQTEEKKIGAMNYRSQNIIQTNWDVTAVSEDGTATLQQTVSRVISNLQSARLGEITFDTEIGEATDGATAALAANAKKILHAPSQFQITKLGDIASRPASTGTTEAAAKSDGDDSTPLNTLGIPKGDLVIGQEWNVKKEIHLPQDKGTLTLRNDYKYLGPVKKEDRVLEQITLAITIEPSKSDADSSIHLPIRIISQSGSGEFFFDAEKGLMSHSKLELELAYQIGPIEKPVNQIVKTTTETTVEVVVPPPPVDEPKVEPVSAGSASTEATRKDKETASTDDVQSQELDKQGVSAAP